MNPQGGKDDNSLENKSGDSLENTSGESLESTSSSSDSGQQSAGKVIGLDQAGKPSPELKKDNEKKTKVVDVNKGPSGFKGILARLRVFDVYILGFVLLLMIAGIIAYVAIQKNKPQNNNVPNQNINQSTLQQLNNNDVQVGSNAQTLNIQSNTIFAGNLLVKQDAQIAGTLKLGGALSLPSINVAGTAAFGQTTVTGNEGVSGTLTVSNGITINGNSTFNGNITANTVGVNSLQLNGDIQILHHITTGGGLPTASNLVGGPTPGVSGSDTAGSVSVSYSSNNQNGGCVASVKFVHAYSSTPNVVITEVGGISSPYFVNNVSTSGFNICISGAAPAGSYKFDYISID